MALFPALKPAIRTFTPGGYSHSVIPSINGLQKRVMTSNALLEQQLRLTFAGLTEAEMLSIRTHYIGQQGRFLGFGIPDSLLSGMTTPANFTPDGSTWIYSSTPQVEDIPGIQRYTVSVELVTVPTENANLGGAELTVSVGLVAGALTVNSAVDGALLTATTSFTEGSPGGDIEIGGADGPGFSLSVTSTLQAGAGSSDSEVADDFGLAILVEDDLLDLGF